ncbi:NAD-dependent succinate-semialdehyde dehydrogenase [Rhizobium sp. L1K21]|uniref:NAD-dependent succinate-semialdehyde dehydrogenase n=1 Tax=Rhizobium sp. L1K21 TaxID=2954933 RepID=UPI00209340FA|nr:NAD-dependent succinate-semialdehyde dehydrogenase [Rhizobium sp. L1K21]MCO6185730.1 NAD-dependent succinate-semialdehyde dehydrogenase [Rhizobium sp. L1K21]
MSDHITTINPATGKELKTYERMSRSEVEDIIKKCHEAHLDWRLIPAEKRAQVVANIGRSLQANKEKLAKIMCEEMGKPISTGYSEVDVCTGICDYTAETGPEFLKEEARDLQLGRTGYIHYSPIGIVYGIQPWNFPAYQVIRYAIASIMTGNGVLLKHASNVTGSGLLLEEIFREGGLPEHLFRVLVIDHDQSNDVIAHELVRGVTFTGSTEGGAKVAVEAAKHVKKSVLELGSNDAFIVMSDADLDLAVEGCVAGRMANNAETCIAAKRFIVVDSVYEEFQARFVERMKAVKSGDPMKEDTRLGPMARKDLREKLHEQVQESVKNGAQILIGGEVPDGDGYYYPATVLNNVQPGQPAYDDELFGPVASLIRAKDDEDAFRLANDSKFGLGGGIFSKNVDHARKLAADCFDTGMVFINGYSLAQPNMPFGGVKNSGYGREHGGLGVREFANAKSIFDMGGTIAA